LHQKGPQKRKRKKKEVLYDDIEKQCKNIAKKLQKYRQLTNPKFEKQMEKMHYNILHNLVDRDCKFLI